MIDWIEFNAVSAIFQLCNGGKIIKKNIKNKGFICYFTIAIDPLLIVPCLSKVVMTKTYYQSVGFVFILIVITWPLHPINSDGVTIEGNHLHIVTCYSLILRLSSSYHHSRFLYSLSRWEQRVPRLVPWRRAVGPIQVGVVTDIEPPSTAMVQRAMTTTMSVVISVQRGEHHSVDVVARSYCVNPITCSKCILIKYMWNIHILIIIIVCPSRWYPKISGPWATSLTCNTNSN